MSPQDMQDIRALARKLAVRVKKDQAFKEQIQQDPVGILTMEGLPEHVVDDFLRETGLSDVSGYLFNNIPLSQICTLTLA